MFTVLSDKFISDYSALLTEKDKLNEEARKNLVSAYADIENIVVNGRTLPESIKEQLKKELAEEYAKDFSTEELDGKIAFYEQYLTVEAEPEIETEVVTETTEDFKEENQLEETTPRFF